MTKLIQRDMVTLTCCRDVDQSTRLVLKNHRCRDVDQSTKLVQKKIQSWRGPDTTQLFLRLRTLVARVYSQVQSGTKRMLPDAHMEWNLHRGNEDGFGFGGGEQELLIRLRPGWWQNWHLDPSASSSNAQAQSTKDQDCVCYGSMRPRSEEIVRHQGQIQTSWNPSVVPRNRMDIQ